MIKEEIVILEREDMFESEKEKDILLIEFADFKISTKPYQQTAIILFIDKNGYTKILKNRYGDKGESMLVKKLNKDGRKN